MEAQGYGENICNMNNLTKDSYQEYIKRKRIGTTLDTQKKVFNWPTSTWKYTQHHQLTENWKLKPQWEIKNTNTRIAKIFKVDKTKLPKMWNK